MTYHLHVSKLWCWEGLGARGEGDDRGWDGWMASPTWWTWVWVNSGSWWWIGRPGVLQFMGSQRAGHDWVTELNWTEPSFRYIKGFKKNTGVFFSELSRWLSGKESTCLHKRCRRCWFDCWVGKILWRRTHSSSLAWRIPWREEPGGL